MVVNNAIVRILYSRLAFAQRKAIAALAMMMLRSCPAIFIECYEARSIDIHEMLAILRAADLLNAFR